MSENTPIETGAKPAKPDTRFKPGNNANPTGRPKGARSKLGTLFIEKMLADFSNHGEGVIEVVRAEKPDQYLKVIASILPKEIEASEELVETISLITRRVVDTSTGPL